MFIGCRNILVEDVTMRDQPAGWSYWSTDCCNVHFHRAQILASVKFPNNDDIHINCCTNVTISDCNITCGNDAFVVRAYSLPMGRNIPCEKVTVTNCNLTSHAFGAHTVEIVGRESRHIENIYFSGCHFTQVPYEEIDNKFGKRLAALNTPLPMPTFRHVDNPVMNNTVFNVH